MKPSPFHEEIWLEVRQANQLIEQICLQIRQTDLNRCDHTDVKCRRRGTVGNFLF